MEKPTQWGFEGKPEFVSPLEENLDHYINTIKMENQKVENKLHLPSYVDPDDISVTNALSSDGKSIRSTVKYAQTMN